jgi:putative toxin-antitoxin system antitoxin component (TIGR02293 family)
LDVESFHSGAVCALNICSPLGIKPKSVPDLIKRIDAGFSLKCIRAFKKQGLTVTEISGCIISTRVLNRRKESGKKLTSRESERVIRVALILDMADKVFGSHEKALCWQREANEQLHGKSLFNSSLKASAQSS